MSQILLSLWPPLKRKTSTNYSTYSKIVEIIRFRREFFPIFWRDWDFDPVSKSIFDFNYISLFNHVVIITELDPKASAPIGIPSDAILSKIVSILESNYKDGNFTTFTANGQDFQPIVVYLTLNEGSNSSNTPGPIFPILNRILFNRQRQALIQSMRPNRRPALSFVPILFRMGLSKAANNQSESSNNSTTRIIFSLSGSTIVVVLTGVTETATNKYTILQDETTGKPIETNSSTPVQIETQSDPLGLFVKLVLATISSKLHQLTCAWWVLRN